MPAAPASSFFPPAKALLERRFTLDDLAATDAFGVSFARAIDEIRVTPGFSGLHVQLLEIGRAHV